MNWSQGFISFCCSVLILVAALSVGYEHLGAQLQASVPPQPVQCVESSDRMVNPGSKLQLPPKSTAFSSRHMKSLSTLFSNVKFGIIGRLKRLKSKLKTILVSFHRRPIIVESRESSLNTHMPINVYEIGLEDWKLNLINTAMRELEQTRHKWQAAADETSILVDEYLVFRYLAACDWGPYNGMRVSEAIMETVHWRKDFGIHKIFEEHLVPYSQMHVAYVSPTPDSHGRSVLYLKPGRLTEPIPADLYLQLLLLSVDRADRDSVRLGSGQFVVVIDMLGFKWSNCPSMSVIKKSLVILQKHYPYRLAAVYIAHVSSSTSYFWAVVKPFIPKKVLEKVLVLSDADLHRLGDDLGHDRIGVSLGGSAVGGGSE